MEYKLEDYLNRRNKPKRGLVDEAGSYSQDRKKYYEENKKRILALQKKSPSYIEARKQARKKYKIGANQFTGPGKLRQDIIDAYKALNKGKKTKTEDIYNYLVNKKNYKTDRKRLKVSIALNLNRENLKFSKDKSLKVRSERGYLKRKTAKVNIPTPVYEKGSRARVIEEVRFPETGPRSKKNFVKDIEEYFSTPRGGRKDDLNLTKKLNKIKKKYFPDGISKSKFQNIYNFVAEKEGINIERPLKYTDQSEKGRAEYKRTKEFQEKFSDVKKETAFKKAKKGSGLDLAHKLSKETSRRFGLQQTTGTQGLQQPVINQAIVKQYEKRLDTLYDLQDKLIKSKPKNLTKQLDLVNRMVTSVVEDSGNRVVGVVVDEKTLQPKLYGNLSGARDTIDSGVFNKKIKNLTQKDMDYITEVLIPQSIKNQAIIGSDLSGMRNIDKKELIKTLKKSKKVGKPIIKETEKLLNKFPEVTKEVGPLGLDVKRKPIEFKFKQAIAKMSENPTCALKFTKGGLTPSLDDCFEQGMQALKEKNIKKPHQIQGAKQLMNAGKRIGASTFARRLLDLGILGEVAFIAGDTGIRMAMGRPFSEAFKAATFRQTSADLDRQKRAGFSEREMLISKAADLENKANSIRQQIQAAESVGDDVSIKPLEDRLSKIREQLNSPIDDIGTKLQTLLLPTSATNIEATRKLENVIDSDRAKSIYSGAELRDQQMGIPGIADYGEIETPTMKAPTPERQALPSSQEYLRQFMRQNLPGSEELEDRTIDRFVEQLSPMEKFELEALDQSRAEKLYGTQGKFKEGGLANLTRTTPPKRSLNKDSQGLASLPEYDR